MNSLKEALKKSGVISDRFIKESELSDKTKLKIINELKIKKIAAGLKEPPRDRRI